MGGGPNVLHVNTLDRGGAANACFRLHTALVSQGFNSKVLVNFKTRDLLGLNSITQSGWKRASRLLVRRVLYKLRVGPHPLQTPMNLSHQQFRSQLPSGVEYFSFPESGIDITRTREYHEADIVHLHWVSDFVDYPSFFRKNRKPVVWTLHDMDPFSGGQHYQEPFCGIDEAGDPVPFELPAHVLNMVNRNLETKKEALSHASKVVVVAPSQWLCDLSARSEILGRFPHHRIPYGLDTGIFQPRDRRAARELFDLPIEKPCLLFVSDAIENFRKGFGFLRRALDAYGSDAAQLCAVGSVNPELRTGDVRFVGRIEDETLMSQLYSAADALIVPSIEDNLPNTAIESILCGTPVLGFRVGGVPEIIVDGKNGYLSPGISVEGLSGVINRFLQQPAKFDRAAIRRDSIARFDQALQARAYIQLYSGLKQK
jgi:glycosyltransferase involved in cell wall biosynthesis